MSFNSLFEIYLQFFFLLTPFCTISVFLSVTSGMDEAVRKRFAVRTFSAISILVLLFFFIGKYLFILFGITLDAFRVGAGATLFLTAVSLVNGRLEKLSIENIEELPVVPLAIPLTVGPGTIGALIVKSVAVTDFGDKLIVSAVLMLTSLSVGALIFFSNILNSILGRRGISVLSRFTGLILGAISAQLIMDGLQAWAKGL